jgi:hypothetical protein
MPNKVKQFAAIAAGLTIVRRCLRRYVPQGEIMKRNVVIGLVVFTVLLGGCVGTKESVKPQSAQKAEDVRNNPYTDMQILNYCIDYPNQVYTECRSFAEQVRTDEAYEWKVFQSLNLPVSVKKARDESKKYSNTVLVSDRELMQVANQVVLPKYGKSLNAGRMNMNAYFCGAGVNNYKHGIVLDQDKLYKDCLQQLDFTKKGK